MTGGLWPFRYLLPSLLSKSFPIGNFTQQTITQNWIIKMKWYKWFSFRYSKDDLQLARRVSKLEEQLRMAVEIQKLQTKLITNHNQLLQSILDKQQDEKNA